MFMELYIYIFVNCLVEFLLVIELNFWNVFFFFLVFKYGIWSIYMYIDSDDVRLILKVLMNFMI